jgi:putative PIN family toxin of toxin-antitoxin system
MYNTTMKKPRIVIDTNILVSALRSRNGASFKLLSLIDSRKFDFFVSTPLVFEYEEALKNDLAASMLSKSDVDEVLNYMCKMGSHQEISYLWRPQLRDPGDDFILEVAAQSGCDFIVTHNLKDFIGTEKFGIKAVTPGNFLRKIGENK